MLSLVDLHKSHPAPAGKNAKVLFAGLALEVAAGARVAIMGESGTGKSTLLNVIAGLERADRGAIGVDGLRVDTLDETAVTLLRRRRIGFVFQAFHVLPYLDVARNVALPLELNDWPAPERDARVAEMLAAVGLADRARSMPRELSGGELQRVAVARALAHRPALVLADEPTGNLDAESAGQVLQLLADEARRSRAALLLVTHSSRAAAIADAVYELAGGVLTPRAAERADP